MGKVNPFKPNSPVPTAMFAGRYEELVELEKGLFQTKNGHSTHYLITGERGIGKSSLLMYLKLVSSGEISSINHGIFKFVTINIILSDRTDLVTLIKLIEKNISRELGKVEKVIKFLSDTWEFVQRIKVMDSGIDKAQTDSNVEILIDDFVYSLSETCKRITNKKSEEENARDGIVFLIDEADNASDNLRIGYFFKAVTELLQQHNCNNIMFVVSGLPDIIEKLSASHQSSIRLFNLLLIKELSSSDRKYVIDKGIESGNLSNQDKTTISEAATNFISNISEGYPHFIQQFAYSAFDHSTDMEISEEDAVQSAFKTGGALDAIGNRYYSSYFHEKIKSDEYRQVLSIMAEKMNTWIKKSEIRAKFSGDEKTLSNALVALTKRKIILKNQSKIGEYRLQQRGFALWIKLFGNRKK